MIGRNWNSIPNYPCRVKRIPSPVPDKKWYLRPWAISLAGGLLPFGSIFIEMYFIFTSFWNYKVNWGRGLLGLEPQGAGVRWVWDQKGLGFAGFGTKKGRGLLGLGPKGAGVCWVWDHKGRRVCYGWNHKVGPGFVEGGTTRWG